MTYTYRLVDQNRLFNCVKFLQSLPPGHLVRIFKPGKTPAQRNYWHNLIGIIAEDQHEDEDDLKTKLKYQWLPLHEVVTDRGVYMSPPSTEKLTKEQYSILIEKTLLLADHLNIVLPDIDHYGMRDDK